MAKKSGRGQRQNRANGRGKGLSRLGGNACPLIGVVIVALLVLVVVILLQPFGGRSASDVTGRNIETGPLKEPQAAPIKGSLAPNFVLTDYDGNALRLDQFRGKVVFLNFWATWCTACASEMPDLNRLAKEHPDDLVVLAVNRGEPPHQAKQWTDARHLDALRFVVDPKESITHAYRLPNGMPNSFFIARDGYLTKVIPGAQSGSQMERNFQEALNAAPAGVPNSY